MAEQVTILGAGQMGLVLADALAARGCDVVLWGPFSDHLEPLRRTRRAAHRLTDFELPDSVRVISDDAAAVDQATLLINAIPTQYIRGVWSRLATVAPAVPVVCVAKGIEKSTLLRPSEIIGSVLALHSKGGPVVALSGPTIAAELAQRLPATMVAACDDLPIAARIQEVFSVSWLRIYTSDDLTGVELAGATKNVIALAAGMVDGLEIGANAKSALLARGLAEIARLGRAMGARLETFFGIAGVGDLATTCFSPFGRNRTCGERIGRGQTLDQVVQSTASVIEGVETTRSLVALADREGVDMPIARTVHAILFEGLTAGEAIAELMNRTPKAEWETAVADGVSDVRS